MQNIIANHVVATFVLLPSTLAAGFYSLFGVAFVTDSFRRAEHLSASLVLLVAMTAGWFGLITAWRLYYALSQGRTDFSRPIAWAGLICGGLRRSASLLLRADHLFFAWPFSVGR
ncbi:hypothetical protein [[Pseudomonas] boreopolis]|uniref:hypothetical protein n=1 Tax=Xanthomonas boreopolis TaxID=86183 RepID=UPI003D9B2890